MKEHIRKSRGVKKKEKENPSLIKCLVACSLAIRLCLSWVNSRCVERKKRSLRAVRATSKTRHTLQEEYEILIKVVHLRIGFPKLQWWELHCSQHCHLTPSLPTTPRRANSHFLSKWHRIRYFVFAPSEVQQWKSIDFKYPYQSWFPSVEPKLCFFFLSGVVLF